MKISFIKTQILPGHDFRYAIDSCKINKELGWKPSLQFEEGIEKNSCLGSKEQRIARKDYIWIILELTFFKLLLYF